MRPGAEMVDSLGLNPSGDFLRVGSTPTPGTLKNCRRFILRQFLVAKIN